MCINPGLCSVLSFVCLCSVLMYALQRTLSSQPGTRWRNAQPSRSEPNSGGRCPETRQPSLRGVSRAFQSKSFSRSLSLSSPLHPQCFFLQHILSQHDERKKPVGFWLRIYTQGFILEHLNASALLYISVCASEAIPVWYVLMCWEYRAFRRSLNLI